MASAGTWVKRIVLSLLAVVGVLLAVIVGALMYTKLPSTAMGMAAESVCSAAFVAGRPADNLMEQDILPASSILGIVSTEVDQEQASVTASLFGIFHRTAWLVDSQRGCVLDVQPATPATPFTPTLDTTTAWPEGDATVPESQWRGVDAAALKKAVDDAFIGAGDPAAANARGVAVVQDGKLLLRQEAPGFEQGTGLHGWSMTKTVAGMLAYRVLNEKGIDLDTPVVDAFPAGREPSWVADWRRDERRTIRISDLMYMRDGLDNTETYDPWSSVPRMLWSEPDMAAWAAGHRAEVPPATRFRYLSATSVILAAVVRGQFATDEEYWAYPYTAMFDPIGARSATLETDTSGTWVGSSYLWASVGDWARLGQLMLDDGRWNGTAILPPGWLDLATTPSMPDGEGHEYGAQTWLIGDPMSGDCKDNPEVPADTMAMSGHWGQMVAMVPSRRAVVVRLGWTFDKAQFDDCAFLGEVLAALPE